MIASPKKTIAVVVGMEEYAAGERWRLDGPVPDACRFASWLRSRGVPPSNITLIAAPLKRNRHFVEEQRTAGVDVVDAHADAIREQLIHKLPRKSSDLLLIHWGGHGVVDDRSERRLIYNDADSHDRRNVNVTALLTLLRSDLYRAHPCQRIVIDSCLTFSRSVGWQNGMPNEEFQHNSALVAVDQLALFAASDGERAKNDDVLQTGLFSQAVLESLATSSEETWPPDFAKVKDDVDILFQARRADHVTRQNPSHIWFRRGSDEESLVFPIESRAAGMVAPGRSPARSRYRDEQVRRIAPRELRDREADLAELRRFCTAPDVSIPYQWWTADAWAGKSALAASFVLDPPAGVQIVSFFVTARWAGHDSRAVFAQIILEQLAEVLNRPMPSVSDVGRDLEVGGMLREAAVACSERGERLVLVVDGLDEDSGAGGSIAELLPADPPAGLRVIVTGRPNPQLPSDVPDDHPLRDPAVVRTLTAAPAATIARAAMERELDALLEGTDEERDLVGLVVAARGGLSGKDLAELTTWTPRRLAKVLNGPAGRSFTRRAADWRPETAPEVFLLAHENLQRAAEEELGEDELRKYRKRLHDWAERYRLEGWPPGTPQYLLRGYFSRLDPASKALYAADPARHERLLAVSRSDAAALAEIIEAQEAVANAGHPDVPTTMRLVMHRENLRDRNARVPTRLPAVLAMLGDIDRAEALATAITDNHRRRYAIKGLIDTLTRSTHRDSALNLVLRIEDRDERNSAIAGLAGALAEAGQLDQAMNLSRSLDDRRAEAWAVSAIFERGEIDPVQARALAEPLADFELVRAALVTVIGRQGDLVEALSMASTLSDGLLKSLAIADLTKGLTSRGDFDTAETILQTTDAHVRFRAMKVLIKAAAAARQFERARSYVHDFVDEDELDGATEALSLGLAAAGEVAEAQALVAGIMDDTRRTLALIELIENVDHIGWARAMAGSIPASRSRTKATAALLKLFCRKGQFTWAERLVPHTSDIAEAFVTLAETAISDGDPDRGRDYIARAEAAARKPGYQFSRPHEHKALKALADVVVQTGDVARAERLARFVADPDSPNDSNFEVVSRLAPLLVKAGDFTLAESFALSPKHYTETQLQLFAPLVRRLWQDGQHERARGLAIHALSIVNDPRDIYVLPLLVEVLASGGEVDRAIELIQANPYQRRAPAALVKALALLDNLERATAALNSFNDSTAIRHAIEELAKIVGAKAVLPLLEKIGESEDQAKAMVAIAKYADSALSRQLLAGATERGHWTDPLPILARDDPEAAMAIFDEYMEHWQPE